MARTSSTVLALYANGNFGKSCLATLIEIYALFYFTDILGISPGIAGLILLVSLVWDAITDPIVGYMGDRLRNRWESIVPYACIGVPATALSFMLFFNLSAFATQNTLLPVAALLLLFFRTAYTLFDVPHNGMISIVSKTPEERTNVASMRIFFSSLGKLSATVLIAWLLDRSVSDELTLSDLQSAALVLTAMFAISATLCALSTKSIRFAKARDQDPPAFIDAWQIILGDRKVRRVFFLSVVNSLVVPAIGAGLIYYAKYSLQNEALGTRAVTYLAVAQTLSLVFWAWAANRFFSKERSLSFAYGVLALAAVWALFEITPQTLPLMASLIGFAVGGIFMLNWSMLPDALDSNEKRTGRSGNFGVFGVYTFSNKAFHGVSQAYVGATLMLLGFSANAPGMQGIIEHMRIAIFVLVLAGSLICCASLCRTDK